MARAGWNKDAPLKLKGISALVGPLGPSAISSAWPITPQSFENGLSIPKSIPIKRQKTLNR
jgi:hypothetical protein